MIQMKRNSDSDDFQDDKSSESSDTDAAGLTYKHPNHKSHKHTSTMTLASSNNIHTLKKKTSYCSKSQYPITGFIENISEVEQKKLKELLATAVYASGALLSMVYNPYWLEFLNRLCPSFNIPQRHQLLGCRT